MAVAKALNRVRGPYLEVVLARPGISTRDVARALGVDDTTAEYHLKRLAAGGVVVRERAGRIVAHYPPGMLSPRERRLARLSRVGHRALGALEASEQELRACQVAARLETPVGPVRYALDQLVVAGLARKSAGGWYASVSRAAQRGVL